MKEDLFLRGEDRVGELSWRAVSDPAPALCGAVRIVWVETSLLVNLELVGSASTLPARLQVI